MDGAFVDGRWCYTPRSGFRGVQNGPQVQGNKKDRLTPAFRENFKSVVSLRLLRMFLLPAQGYLDELGRRRLAEGRARSRTPAVVARKLRP